MIPLQVQVCSQAVTLYSCWLLFFFSEAAFTSCSVAKAQLNQISSSASETSEPRHILNMDELKSSEARPVFAFSLLRNVTHHFQ